MAEFGIAARVLQVASFGADVSSALYKSFRDVKNAARDIKALAEEVDATTKVLDAVASLLGNPKTASLHTTQLITDTENVLDGCRKVFDELDSAAKQASGGLVEQSTWGRLTTKAKRPLSKGRVTELQGVLERYRGVMHMMLTVLQIGEGRSAATTKDLQSLEQRLEALITTRINLGQGKPGIDTALDHIIEPSVAHEAQHDPSTSRGGFDTMRLRDNTPNMSRSRPSIVGATQSSTSTVGSASHEGATNLPNISFIAAVQSPTLLDSSLTGEQDVPVNSEADAPPLLPPKPLAPRNPILLDLEHCKAAIDQLASSLAATLAQLQGQPHPSSTDINAALDTALRRVKQLPAGLQCRSCRRQIPWRQVGQSREPCREGRECVVGFLPLRMYAAEYSVKHIDADVSEPLQRENQAVTVSRVMHGQPTTVGEYSIGRIDANDAKPLERGPQATMLSEGSSRQQIPKTTASGGKTKRTSFISNARASMPARRRPTAREPIGHREAQGIPLRYAEYRLSRCDSPASPSSSAGVIRRVSFTIEVGNAADTDRLPPIGRLPTAEDGERHRGSNRSVRDPVSDPPLHRRYDTVMVRHSSIDPSRCYDSFHGEDSDEDEEDAVEGVKVGLRTRPKRGRQPNPATVASLLKTTRSVEELGSTRSSSRNRRRAHSEGSAVLPGMFIATSASMPYSYAHMPYSRPPALVRESRPYARSSAAHAEDPWPRLQREAAGCRDSGTFVAPPPRPESRNQEAGRVVPTDAAAALLKRWLLPGPGNEQTM